MNIGSGNSYPSNALSNFAPHPFTIDNVEVASMEGFLQALKFENVDMQVHVCTLVGVRAKFKGKRKKWWKQQVLFWNGETFQRESEEYIQLIRRAYIEMVNQNLGFRKALLATGNSSLTHSIGKRNPKETVLTEQEFCSILYEVREIARLLGGNK